MLSLQPLPPANAMLLTIMLTPWIYGEANPRKCMFTVHLAT